MAKKFGAKKWELEIIRKSKLFAKIHNLHFDKGTELMLINAIREAEKKTKSKVRIYL